MAIINLHMRHRFLPLLVLVTAIIGASCTGGKVSNVGGTSVPVWSYDGLEDSLTAIADEAPGEVGIAIIVEGRDTLVVNNTDAYPLMSVFKLHQAVALCHELDAYGGSVDTVLDINRADLDLDTWSPMLTDYDMDFFRLSVRELMEYALMQSDNNASNLLFDRLLPVARTDSIIATLIPREGFAIAVSEAEMHRNHSLSYANHSSPLSSAMLLERLFGDSILLPASKDVVCNALRTCKTGVDRISAPLADKEGVVVAHKTGSGYRNERGELMAHNDVAYIILPDGRHYTIAVFVKDFRGDEADASAIISKVSALTYDFLMQ